MTPGATDGARAPEFRLPVVGGGFRSLADLVEGGGGVLVFFKDGCPGSELVLPRLGPLWTALEREGRAMLAVAQEDEAVAAAFRSHHGLRFPVAWEIAPYEVSRAYAVTVVPTLFIIDGTGIIAERLEGFVKLEYQALGASLEQALALGDIPPVLDRPGELPALKAG